MRRIITLPVLAVLAALAAAPAAAQLSQLYVEWAEGPARYLFTKEDREAWKRVGGDREAEDFVRLFWARRDPAPESAENEFRREFERRVAFADQRFGETVDEKPVRGSLTDRGRAFILLGPPRRLQDPGAAGTTTGGDFGGASGVLAGDGGALSGAGPLGTRGGAADRFGVASEEVWIYEGDSRPSFMEKKRVRVVFHTKPGTEEVELFQGEEALGYMGEAIARAVVHPELTLADVAPSAAAEPVAADAGGFGLFGADPLADDRALEALRASLEARPAAAVESVHLDAGAFQASDGTWIVPVQVATEGPAPPAGTVMVGELVDAAGESKVAFRLEPEWKESRDQRYAKATVVAPPGEYRLRAALESPAGEVLWAGQQEVEVPAESSGFWVSEVILSEDIHPMQQAQQVLEPWAWMGIAVVPEGDRTFAQGGVLWYYLHACQPALDPSGKPKLRVSLELTGAASFRGPAVSEPVKAGDNCWVLASAYDLVPDRFPPGAYTMKVTVRDSVSGQTVQAPSVEFRVAAGG